MKFPYQQYRIQPAPGFSEGILYRPRIPIIVIGPTGEIGFEALVDTGSDQTIFPRIHAETIGVTIDDSRSSQIKGRLDHHREDVVLGKNVTISLKLDGEMYAWESTVWFSDSSDSPAILGHSGFLEFFTATFDGERHELGLKPNKTFPGRVIKLWNDPE